MLLSITLTKVLEREIVKKKKKKKRDVIMLLRKIFYNLRSP